MPNRTAWISAKARQVFSAYRRDEFADPDGFLAQLGMILERYSDDVIETVTSPFSGLQRTHKWPPSMAEVIDACEHEAVRRLAISKMVGLKPVPRLAGPKRHRANVFVPPNAPQYAAMLERTVGADPMDWRNDETRPGVWVPYGWLMGPSAAKKSLKMFSEEQLRAMYPPREKVDAKATEVPFD
jgi:hypothetical protein